MRKVTIKIVEAQPVFGLRGYLYQCIACGEKGNPDPVRAHAEQAAQMHLNRVHHG